MAPIRVMLFAILISGLPMSGANAQEGRGHSLYGELRVDESGAGKAPQTYTVILARVPGFEPRRLILQNGGRYRFNEVQNGEYNLIVEVEGQEVARIPLLLQEKRGTDLRRDIELAWKPGIPEAKTRPADAGAPMDIYSRPRENHALFRDAQAAMAGKDFRKAAALLDRIVGRDPKDFEAWTELGTALFNVEKKKDAEEAYRKALGQKPGFAPAQLNLGKVLLALKDYQGALDALDQAVQDHPESADIHYYLGEACLQVKKGSKASVHLNEALRLDPIGKAEAHLRLGALYNAAGMKDRAANEYEQFLKKVPTHPQRESLSRYINQNKK